eukprot:TRINITY_DN1774_c0_g1_i1.p1 TRINITY_DN1774_c0_g1~~TRINITY_DN1774_c0_g1_i1.p1  ORF type:complete len:357 (-),score=82.15 TRINITY_DN1774_c0_g1_i1:141-1211(-)
MCIRDRVPTQSTGGSKSRMTEQQHQWLRPSSQTAAVATTSVFTSLGSSPMSTSADSSKDIPTNLNDCLTALRILHEEYMKLEDEMKREMRLVQKKYEQQYFAKLFDKRSALVNGQMEPHIVIQASKEGYAPQILFHASSSSTASPISTTASTSTQSLSTKPVRMLADEPKKDRNLQRGIPGFWLQALRRHEILRNAITPADALILMHLTDIRSETLEDGNSFKLEFHFSTNSFFENQVITKTYYISDDDYSEVFDNIEITPIKWKEDRPKVSFQKRGASKAEADDDSTLSFFNFFTPIDMRTIEPQEGHTMEESFEIYMANDLELGSIIRDRIVSQALLWFTGEVLGDDDDDEDDE